MKICCLNLIQIIFFLLILVPNVICYSNTSMQCYSVHYFSELVCVCVFHTFAHILLLIQSYAYTLLCFSCSKSILKDYADLTDFSTPEHIEIYKRIHDQASSLSPVTEYKVFVDQNK